jgi:SAM-dependent methyltransferase
VVFPQPQDPGYSAGLNELLLDAVPDAAMTVVEMGCAEGRLGAELKQRVPGRRVIGVEIDPAFAEEARTRLDEVVVHDLMTGPPPIQPGTADVITFGDVLEHLVDPEAVLVAVRDLLAPGGRVIASIPNIGHHSVLRPLLRGDFMYQPQGQLDATHVRFFTYATIWKLFLDAGYLPRIHAISSAPISDGAFRAITPALLHHRVDPERARKHLGAFQYVVEATPAEPRPDGYAAPLTFACLVNDTAQLESNLLRSPVLAPGSPHQVILLPDQTSAAEGLRTALARAQHDVVVLVQQDVYLPRGWDHAFRASWDEATKRHGRPGIAGVFGLRYRDRPEPLHVGRVIDRDRLLDEPEPLPATVDSLDEVLLALPKDTTLEPDPGLGFHLYGSDLAIQAQDQGLPVVVLDAVCFHNSLFAHLDAGFHASRERLLEKWSDRRPLRSNMGSLDDLRPVERPAYWPRQLQRDLRTAQQRAAALEKQLAKAQERLEKVRGRARNAREELAEVKGSRVWRARDRVARALGRS